MHLLLTRPVTYLLSTSGILLAASLLVASAADEKADKKDAKTTAIKPEAVKLGRPVDFLKDVYPALEQNCVACHNVAINESKLVLEEVKDILKGGKRGTSIVAKQPEKSLLYLVASRQKKPHMPPLPNNQDAKAFTPRELGLLRQWILEGAAGGTGGRKQMLQFAPLPDSARAIYSVAISPWNRFAAAGRANQVTIYDTTLGEKVSTLVDPNLAAIKFADKLMYPGGATHRDFVHSMSFNPSGDMLATGGYRVVKLWKRDAARQVAKLAGPSVVTATAIGADGKTAAVANADNIIRLVNLADGKVIRELKGHTAAVSGVAFFPHPLETSRLAAATATADAALATAVTGQATADTAVKEFDPKALKLEGDAIAAEKKKRTDAAAAAKKGADAAKTALAAAKKTEAEFAKLAAEGSQLVSGSQDKSVRVWKIADGSLVRQVATPAAVNDVAFTKDGARLVSAHADNLLRVWTTAKPKPAEKKADDKKKDKDAKDAGEKPVLEIKGHTKPVTGVALILPAGTQIATSSGDNTVRIFDVTKGNQIRSINVGSPVSDVAVRPDGKAIAAAAGNFARLYDLAGKQLAELKGDLVLTRTLATATEEQNVNKQLVGVSDGKQKAADKTAKDRTAAAKKAKDAKTAADKKVTEQKPKFAAAKTKSDGAVKAFGAAAKALVDAKKAAVDAAKKATDLKKAADDTKKLADAKTKKSADLAKTSETAKKAATGVAKKLTAAQAVGKKATDAAKAATDAKAKADKAAADTKKTSDLAAKAATDAAKALTDAQAADKKADEAIKAAGDDAAKKKAAEEAKKKTAEAVKVATEAKAKADKAAADAKKASDAAVKTAADAAKTLTAAQAVAKKETEAVKVATAAKVKADKTATDAAKAAIDAKKVSDAANKKSTDAATAAKTAAAAKTKSDAASKTAQTKNDTTKKAKDDTEKETAKQKAELKKVTDAQASADRTQKLADKATSDAQVTLKTANTDKAAKDARQKIVDAVVTKATAAIKTGEKPISVVAFSPDGKLLLTGGADQRIHVWYAAAGKAVEMISGHTGAITSLSISPSGLVLSGSADKLAATWDISPRWSLAGQLGPKADKPLDLSESPFVSRVLSVDFSHDGKLLVTGGGDPSRSGELMIWDVAKKSLVKEFKDAHSDTVFGAEFSRDGTKLLSGAADKFVKIFDVASGKHIRSFEGHTHHVLDVSWKADNTSIASAGADNVIKVWNVDTGEQRRTIGGYSKQVTSLRFVGIGENVISCAGDKAVRFHKTGNGQNFRSFSGGTDFMYAAASSRDESFVVAGGEDGIVRLWNGKDAKLLKAFNP